MPASPAEPEDGEPEDGEPEDGEPEDGEPEDGEPEDWESGPEDMSPEDEEGGPVIMRPLPLPGYGFNPIVGGGRMWGAFEEERPATEGYLAEIPGEVLLEVSGPHPRALSTFGLGALALTLLASPIGLHLSNAVSLFPRDQRAQVWFSAFGASLVGLVLAGLLLIRLFRAGTRATLTSAGIAVQSSTGATWTEWAEVLAYTSHDHQSVSLELEEGSVELLPSPEEFGPLVRLLDEREISRR